MKSSPRLSQPEKMALSNKDPAQLKINIKSSYIDTYIYTHKEPNPHHLQGAYMHENSPIQWILPCFWLWDSEDVKQLPENINNEEYTEDYIADSGTDYTS